MPSVHKECGADISWARRPDDPERFLPPLEYAGELFVIENGTATQHHGYRVHLCDPQRIIEWKEYQEQLASAKGEEYTPYAAAREKELDELWAFVEGVACPTCDVSEGKCISQSRHLKSTGEVRNVRSPHQSRIDHAEAWKKGKKE